MSAEITDSYYNMSEILKDHMHLVKYARKAIEQIGLTAHIRLCAAGTTVHSSAFRDCPVPTLTEAAQAFTARMSMLPWKE